MVAGSQCVGELDPQLEGPQIPHSDKANPDYCPIPSVTPSPAPWYSDPDVWFSADLISNDTWASTCWYQATIPSSFGFEKQGFALVGYMDWLWAFGGTYVVNIVPSTVFEVTNDVYRTDDGFNWEKMPLPPWNKRRKLVAAALSSNKLFLMAGWDAGPASNTPGQDDDLNAVQQAGTLIEHGGSVILVAPGSGSVIQTTTVVSSQSASPSVSVSPSFSASTSHTSLTVSASPTVTITPSVSAPATSHASSATPSLSASASASISVSASVSRSTIQTSSVSITPSSSGSVSITRTVSPTISNTSSITPTGSQTLSPSPSPSSGIISCQLGDIWVLYADDSNTTVFHDDTKLTWAFVSSIEDFAGYGMAWAVTNTTTNWKYATVFMLCVLLRCVD